MDLNQRINSFLKLGQHLIRMEEVAFNEIIDKASHNNPWFTTENIKLTINLEYFNTAVSKQLIRLFQELEANSAIKKVNVRWHYEEGDDDIFETGKMYQEFLTKIEFEFLEFEEI